ncbi:MAG: MFS transporter, partial [Pseudomonadota bacterium]
PKMSPTRAPAPIAKLAPPKVSRVTAMNAPINAPTSTMNATIRPLTAVLFSAAILMIGNGLLGLLIPLRAGAEGFSGVDIGILGSAYFGGFVAGCFITPSIISRVGHIRAFAGFTALLTITPLLQAIWTVAPAWWLLRVVAGFCFASLYMVMESWLNDAANKQNRGQIFSLYTMLNMGGMMVGMQLMVAGPTEGFELFSLAAVIFSLACLPIALTRSAAPAPPKRVRLRIAWLFKVSPSAFIGSVCTGVANGAFLTLAALYAKELGFAPALAALFVSSALLGGTLAEWPIGILSDRLGRRFMTLLSCSIAAAAGVLLFIWGSIDVAPIGVANPLETGALAVVPALGLAILYGAFAFPNYALNVAHANDLVARRRAVQVSGGLLLVFSLGAAVGPLLASLLVDLLGYRAVFLTTAVAHISLVAALLFRSVLRPDLPDTHQEDFVGAPRTTPAAYDFDPRTPYEESDPAVEPAPVEPAAAEGAKETGPETGPETGQGMGDGSAKPTKAPEPAA